VTIENLARGVVPPGVHFHLTRYDLTSLPTNDLDLSAWLFKRWTEKDARLEAFYSQPPESRAFAQTKSQADAQAQFKASRSLNLLFRKFSLAFIFGAVFLLGLYVAWSHPLLICAFHGVLVVAWLMVGKRYNGFDSLILKVEKTYELQQQKLKAATTTSSKSDSSKKAN
jgi:hypothetical protein